jgi:predicted transcriptional regulator
MIEELPEDITVSDVMAELYFRQNVDEGLKELDEGKGLSHEEAKKRLSEWLTHGARLLSDDLVEGGSG